MKLVDTNVLLYTVDESSPHHERAHVWLHEGLSGGFRVGFAMSALLSFIRISTDRRVYAAPLKAQEALDNVAGWLKSPSAQSCSPTPRHFEIMGELMAGRIMTGSLVMDADLAALAVEHRAEVATFDRDFLGFKGLKVEILG